MAQTQLIQLLSTLQSRIEMLVESQNVLLKKIEELEKKNIVLENQIKSDAKIIEEANKNLEFLTLSHRLADSPDTIISTRKKITGLIRTINNCIQILEKE